MFIIPLTYGHAKQRTKVVRGCAQIGMPSKVLFSFNYSQSIGKKEAKHEILQAGKVDADSQ